MDRGRTFYICLFCGLIALGLLLLNTNLPAQLVFETKPYARLVLASGNLDGWTAEKLGLDPGQFEMVKNNYAEYLRRHKTDDDSESEGSDSDTKEEETYAIIVPTTKVSGIISKYKLNNDDEDDDDDDDRKKRREAEEDDDDDDEDDDANGEQQAVKLLTTTEKVEKDKEEEESESSDEDGDESDEEMPLEQKLQEVPLRQTVGIGLFHAQVCDVSRRNRQRCYTVSVNEAIMEMNEEASFMTSDINMPMWNNLRVETLFALVACVIGLVFLLSALRPCCDNRRLPIYLGALSFFASGVLIFIPIVRLLLVSSDFEQNLLADMNITTKLMTSWSLLASGIAALFALMAAFSLIATKWYRFSKKWYHLLKTKAREPTANGVPAAIPMAIIKRESTTQPTSAEPEHEHEANLYENMEDHQLLDTKDEKEKLPQV